MKHVYDQRPAALLNCACLVQCAAEKWQMVQGLNVDTRHNALAGDGGQ